MKSQMKETSNLNCGASDAANDLASATPHSTLHTSHSEPSAPRRHGAFHTPNSIRQKGVIQRLTSFARGADPGQRRAAGNIFKFLALLLALTIIARGTSAATLARVDVSAPARSSIVDAVTGNATVSSRDTLDVTAPEGLTVSEMIAGVGQSVKTGDELARFDRDEVEEKLLRERISLDRMLYDLDRYERSEAADASPIDTAMRSLRRAQEDYDTTRRQGETDVAAARTALNEALDDRADDPDATALQNAFRSLQRTQDDYETTKVQGESDITAAEATLLEARESQPNPVDHSQVESAQRSLQRANEDYATTKSQGNADVAAAWDTLYTLELSGASDREIDQAWNSVTSAQRRADDNLVSAKRRVEDAEIALEKAVQDYDKNKEQAAEARQNEIDRALDALETAQSKAEDNLLSAARRLEDAEIAYEKAEQDLSKNSQQQSETLQNTIDRARDALETAQSRAQENLQSARRRVEDAEISLANAEQNYTKSEQQMIETASQNELSASSLLLDIDAQKVTVDALEGIIRNNYTLYSNIEGTVSSTVPEGSVTGKTPLVSFMDGAKGFEAQTQISKTDADKLAVGDECEVTAGGGNMYFTPTVAGIISGISLPDVNDRVTVTIRLPGSDWTQGQRVEVQVMLSSGSYDFCVPVSALHSDNTGYYLFTVERLSTVLGLQNVVTRVNVNVAASDSDMASVRGPVNRDSQVITGSNKSVTAGDRVRVNEN